MVILPCKLCNFIQSGQKHQKNMMLSVPLSFQQSLWFGQNKSPLLTDVNEKNICFSGFLKAKSSTTHVRTGGEYKQCSGIKRIDSISFSV